MNDHGMDMQETVNVAFIGNPNSGKTTLFNAYTGARLKVANWPGVTVEKKEGVFRYHDHRYKLVDLPGVYSLTSYSIEETVSRNYILSDDVDVIVNVVDASSLERNMFLTLSLIELGKPVVVALNMMDIVEERGMEIDLHRLPEMLGVPVIPVSARKRTGLGALMHAVAHHKDNGFDRPTHHHDKGKHAHSHHDEFTMVYSDDIEDKIDIVIALYKDMYPKMENARWCALKALEHDEDVLRRYPLDVDKFFGSSLESQIINQKYDFIEEIIHEVLINKEETGRKTDKADSLLAHPVWGMPIFFLIMAFIFFLTFTVGDFFKGYFEDGLSLLMDTMPGFLGSIGAGAFATSLIVDGIIAGVGGILTFLPNIFIMFLLLAFLEDSGYMARVAYVMDGVMSSIGLSGRAFIPMILGFGCTVPAVMAARTLESERDRIKTILLTPFMSCSAKLPIYILFSQMFFGKSAVIAAYSMYVIGALVAVVTAFAIKRISKSAETQFLLIELPEYKTPNLRTVFIYVWDKMKDYLVRAGTTIFAASVILWFLLNYGPGGMVEEMSDSFAAALGRMIVPIMEPAGLGFWPIVVSLISGIAAKEVVVSSISVLYGIGGVTSAAGMAELGSALGGIGFSAVNAYSLMLFSLLYVPCVAAVATIRKEIGGKWAAYSVALQMGTAWLLAAIFYNIAGIFIR